MILPPFAIDAIRPLITGRGGLLYVLRHRLGHANIRTTYDLYAHAMPGDDPPAAETLDQFLRGRWQQLAAGARIPRKIRRFRTIREHSMNPRGDHLG